ncbi:MAG: hypothetical protein ACRDBQ_18385 [Shewanella sp.]
MTDKIAIVGFPGYTTDGIDVYSFKRGPIKPVKKKWYKLRGIDAVSLCDGVGGYRTVSRDGLKLTYEQKGVLPPPGSLRTQNPKRKQYWYMLDGKKIPVKKISEITGLSEPNIRVRMMDKHVLRFGNYTFTKVPKK